MSFSDHILNTKLQEPKFEVKLLERPRILETLKQYPSRKLTLITAPAGYGKTVLIYQFSKRISFPTAWYQLDQFDNDFNMFIQHLLAGLDPFLPGVVTDMLYIIEQNHNNSNGETRRIAMSLVNSLTDRLEEDLVLAIDDYHVIEENMVHEFIEQMLYYLPSNMHIFMTSRTRPPLNLERLRIAGLMEEINLAKLRFTREEVRGFLTTENNTPVSDKTVTFLHEKTGGWPAALRLAWIAMTGDPENHKPEIKDALPNRKEIYNYLATEVLSNLPDYLSDFVLSTSVLDTITPEICDLFLERTDSRRVLEELESRNLFLTAMEGESLQYQYHPLFKEFLQNQLHEVQKKSLLEKAGYSYLQADYLFQAIECFLSAESFSQALSTIEKVSSKVLIHNHWQTVQRWLESIPTNLKMDRPRVLLLEGSVYLNNGWLSQAEKLINEAASALSNTSDWEGNCQANLYQARVLRFRGEYKKSLEILEQILPKLSESPVRYWYEVILEQSLILIIQGEFSKAMNLLEPALARAEYEAEKRIAAWLSERLGMLYYFKGDYSRSVEVHQRQVELAPKQDRLSFSMRDSMAAIFHDWGDLEQALDYAQNSIKIKERLGLIEALPYAYSQLALILASMDKSLAAEVNFRHSIDLTWKIEGEKLLLPLIQAFYSKFLTSQGRLKEARSLGKQSLEISKRHSEFIHVLCKEMVASAIFEEGNLQESSVMLKDALKTLERIGAKYFIFHGKSYLAAIYREQGYQLEAEDLAKSIIELAGSEEYMQLFISNRQMMFPVVRIGLIEGMALVHVYEIIRQWGVAAEELLLELSHHEYPKVRQRAILAMPLIEGKNIIRTLEKLLDDPCEDVRDHALATLATLKKTVEPDKTSIPDKENFLEVQCLGPFHIIIDGKEVTWRTTKARDLFAYLFHHRDKQVFKDKILEDLWPDSTPERASTLFHTNLYHLRKALKPYGKQIVKHKGKEYYLDLSMLSSDISIFETHATPPEKEKEEEKVDISELERVVSLYQGEYMENLDYTWITTERERLNQNFISLLDRLARLYVKNKDFDKAASCLKTILNYNPLLEDTHVFLMKIYSSMGDRMAVIQQYQTLYQVLEEELGIEPASKTKELYYRLCSEKD